MHELLLVSPTAVPPSGVHHVLAVLAGLAAAQPTPYAALHLVFKPTRAPASVNTATRSTLPQQAVPAQRVAGASGDLFYLQLVGMLHEAGRRHGTAPQDIKESATVKSSGINGTATVTDDQGNVNMADADLSITDQATQAIPTQSVLDLASHPWTLEFRDFPDPAGRRPVTSRLMASVPLSGGDPVAFVRALGYEFEAAHVRRGWRIVHGNVEVLLMKILPVPSDEDAGPGKIPALPVLRSSDLPIPNGEGKEGAKTTGAASGDNLFKGSATGAGPDVDGLAQLDPSGAFILSASVRVADDGVPDVLAAGTQELMSLRNALKGIAELEIGERIAMDTRVRG